ncbi:MAG: hypothetical protein ACPLSY_03345 [Moorellaceae bacterium]
MAESLKSAVPLKYRKYFWAGWYVRWEWRYKCHFCGRKGFTPFGLYKHLIDRHDLEEWEAYSLREKAVQRDDLDERRVKIGGMTFCVGG